MLEIERGSTGSHCVENWLWKRLWTCRKTDYGMNELHSGLLLNINFELYVVARDCCALSEILSVP